jgi:transcriptional regulator with XRE-family HTH domain
VSCREVWLSVDFVGYSPEVDDDTSGTLGPRREGAPERRITPNMLAAYNMARWRNANGMTQEQLGEQLGGWTKTTVSAAERSWDGKRIRQFDADLIVRLANIFGVPVPAMFMPPEDDGESFRYIMDAGGGSLPVGDFFISSVHTVFGVDRDETAAGRAYGLALPRAMAKYESSWLAEVVEARLSQRASDAKLATALARALDSSAALLFFDRAVDDMKKDNHLLKDLLVGMLRETEEGRARLEEQDEEQLRQTWADLIRAKAHRRGEQEQFIAVARELFGDRSLTRDEMDQVLAEGRQRGIGGTPWTRERLLDGKRELVAPPPPGRNRES